MSFSLYSDISAPEFGSGADEHSLTQGRLCNHDTASISCCIPILIQIPRHPASRSNSQAHCTIDPSCLPLITMRCHPFFEAAAPAAARQRSLKYSSGGQHCNPFTPMSLHQRASIDCTRRWAPCHVPVLYNYGTHWIGVFLGGNLVRIREFLGSYTSCPMPNCVGIAFGQSQGVPPDARCNGV